METSAAAADSLRLSLRNRVGGSSPESLVSSVLSPVGLPSRPTRGPEVTTSRAGPGVSPQIPSSKPSRAWGSAPCTPAASFPGRWLLGVSAHLGCELAAALSIQGPRARASRFFLFEPVPRRAHSQSRANACSCWAAGRSVSWSQATSGPRAPWSLCPGLVGAPHVFISPD